MKTVIWSAGASLQYIEALKLLAERNFPAAAKLAERIRETLEALAVRSIGRPGHDIGTFEKIVLNTPYLLVYELGGDELRVLRLLHMSQDWRERDGLEDEA